MKRASVIFVLAASVARADSLDAVLKRMDDAANSFKSLTAKVHKTDYTAALDETEVEDATFKMLKKGKMNVIMLAEFYGRDPRELRIGEGKGMMYYPKANSVDIYETQKFTKSADLLMLVGFGTTRAELQKKFDIKFGGPETIGGVKTTRIDLTPKSKQEQALISTIQLWIPENEGNPIQDKILKGKNYDLFQFSDRKINPQIPESEFDLNLPKDVRRIDAGK